MRAVGIDLGEGKPGFGFGKAEPHFPILTLGPTCDQWSGFALIFFFRMVVYIYIYMWVI